MNVQSVKEKNVEGKTLILKAGKMKEWVFCTRLSEANFRIQSA